MTTTPATLLGSAIRAARRRLGFTQGELAHAAGISHASVIGLYERGAREPSLRVTVQIARALGLDLNSVAECFPAN